MCDQHLARSEAGWGGGREVLYQPYQNIYIIMIIMTRMTLSVMKKLLPKPLNRGQLSASEKKRKKLHIFVICPWFLIMNKTCVVCANKCFSHRYDSIWNVLPLSFLCFPYIGTNKFSLKSTKNDGSITSFYVELSEPVSWCGEGPQQILTCFQFHNACFL
jgi:hypothetical protein